MDETGQDPALSVFVVVAVVKIGEQDSLRNALVSIGQQARVGLSKWHDARPARRLRYIELALERKLGQEEVFFGLYPKPLPFHLPVIEVLERAIRAKAEPPYTARVFVDGIHRKKAAELTNALRLHGISLEMAPSRRDESEPIIRLADMWAGCIRGAILGKPEEQSLLRRALEGNYLRRIKEKPLETRGLFFIPAILPCGKPISAERAGLRRDLYFYLEQLKITRQAVLFPIVSSGACHRDARLGKGGTIAAWRV